MPFPAALQLVDETILHLARGSPSAAVSLFYVFTIVGGGWGLLFLLPFLYWKRTRLVALWIFAATVLTSGVVSSLKYLIGRVRPCDALAWCAPIDIPSPGGHSFPSGHAAGSFTFAVFIACRAPRFAPLALAFAVIVAWSRCVLGVHYPSDVLAGALIGAVIGASMAKASLRAAKPSEGATHAVHATHASESDQCAQMARARSWTFFRTMVKSGSSRSDASKGQ